VIPADASALLGAYRRRRGRSRWYSSETRPRRQKITCRYLLVTENRREKAKLTWEGGRGESVSAADCGPPPGAATTRAAARGCRRVLGVLWREWGGNEAGGRWLVVVGSKRVTECDASCSACKIRHEIKIIITDFVIRSHSTKVNYLLDRNRTLKPLEGPLMS
jgi:hypothetical protein